MSSSRRSTTAGGVDGDNSGTAGEVSENSQVWGVNDDEEEEEIRRLSFVWFGFGLVCS